MSCLDLNPGDDWRILPVLAPAASPEEFVTVVGDCEMVGVGNSFLEFFDPRILKFDNPAAVDADEVVVVGPVHHPLIILFPPPKIVLFQHPFPCEEV